MITQVPGLMDEIRSKFAHVDACPFEGPRGCCPVWTYMDPA